jgi:hypothetical protein
MTEEFEIDLDSSLRLGVPILLLKIQWAEVLSGFLRVKKCHIFSVVLCSQSCA